jgi:hypothetical protein
MHASMSSQIGDIGKARISLEFGTSARGQKQWLLFNEFVVDAQAEYQDLWAVGVPDEFIAKRAAVARALVEKTVLRLSD